MQPEEHFHPSLMGYFPKLPIPFVWVLAGVAVGGGSRTVVLSEMTDSRREGWRARLEVGRILL
jgi:hypothetical protein